MSTLRPTPAKILQHSEGMGAPSASMVRQRATELARIAGRTEFNDEDWREAKRELHGGHDMIDGNGEIEMTSLVSEHDMVASDAGHHVHNMPMEDAENVVEELIAEGMDEAVHEQMLAARKEHDAEDSEG